MKNIKNLLNKVKNSDNKMVGFATKIIGLKNFKLYAISAMTIVVLTGGGFLIVKGTTQIKLNEQRENITEINKGNEEENLTELMDTLTKDILETEKAKGNNITEEEAKKIAETKIDVKASMEDQIKQATEVVNTTTASKEVAQLDNKNKEIGTQQEAKNTEESKQQAELKAKADAEASARAAQEAEVNRANAIAAQQRAEAEAAAQRAAQEAASKAALSGWKDDVAYSIYGKYAYNYEWNGKSEATYINNAFSSLVAGSPIDKNALNTKMFNEVDDTFYLNINGYGKFTVKGLDKNVIGNQIHAKKEDNIRDYMLVKIYYDGPSDTSTVYFIGCGSKFSQYGIEIS